MKNDFGSYLKSVRKSLGLSLRDLESRTGISNPYLSQLERGKRTGMSCETMSRLADALGARADKMFLEFYNRREKPLDTAGEVASNEGARITQQGEGSLFLKGRARVGCDLFLFGRPRRDPRRPRPCGRPFFL